MKEPGSLTCGNSERHVIAVVLRLSGKLLLTAIWV